MKTCIIVANGEFAKHKIPLQSIKNADFIIACDGACNELLKRNIDFDIGIGDFDSIDKTLFDEKKLIHIQEQETNDLCKAFCYALKLSFERITIVCATGLRDDHHIANIFYLDYFCELENENKTKPIVSIQSDFGEFFCHKGSFTQKCKKSQQISLFSTDKNAIFNSIGLKYEIKNFSFKYLFSGTLNETLYDSFTINTNKNNKLIVFLNYI